MSERFGYDHYEGLIFDRTKPCKVCDSDEPGGEPCGLFEEVTTEDLIEIANDLVLRLDAAEKQLAAHNRRCGYCNHWSVVEKCTMCEAQIGGDAGISIEHDLNQQRLELQRRLDEMTKRAEAAEEQATASSTAHSRALAGMVAARCDRDDLQRRLSACTKLLDDWAEAERQGLGVPILAGIGQLRQAIRAPSAPSEGEKP